MLHHRAATIAFEIAALADSRLFDADWYATQYPGSIQDERDALTHYCDIGWRLGYWPNPLFDPQFYLDQNADVRDAHLNPLYHYVRDGEAEGRWPSATFDPAWYREYHSDIQDAGVSPLEHFITFGQHEGRSGYPVTTSAQQTGDATPAEATDSTRETNKIYDCIAASGLFDTDFYLANYPDVRHSGQDALLHFVTFGWQEGRRPNPYFDPAWYCRHYLADDHSHTINPLAHYLTFGEGRAFRPILYFETEWYRRIYKLTEHQSPLWHFLHHRRTQRFSPLSYFDVTYYMDCYGQDVGLNRDPFAHFLRVGIYRDLNPSPAFDLARYRAVAMPPPPPPSRPSPGGDFLEKIKREQFNPLVHFLLKNVLPNGDHSTLS